MDQGVIPRYNPEYCKAGTSGACQTLGEPQRIERYRCHCKTIKKKHSRTMFIFKPYNTPAISCYIQAGVDGRSYPA